MGGSRGFSSTSTCGRDSARTLLQRFQAYKILDHLAGADHQVHSEVGDRETQAGVLTPPLARATGPSASNLFFGVLIRNSLQFISPLVSTLGHIVRSRD